MAGIPCPLWWEPRYRQRCCLPGKLRSSISGGPCLSFLFCELEIGTFPDLSYCFVWFTSKIHEVPGKR